MDNQKSEIEMREALATVVNNFEEYKDEFEKLMLICKEYEIQCEQLSQKLLVFESILKSSRELISSEDWQGLKKFYSAINF